MQSPGSTITKRVPIITWKPWKSVDTYAEAGTGFEPAVFRSWAWWVDQFLYPASSPDLSFPLPTGVPLACLAGIEPAFRLRLGAEVGAPSLTDDWYELAESTSVEAKEEARGLSFQAKEQGMSALLLKRIRFLAPFYTQIPDWTSVHSLTYLSVDWCTNKTQNPWFEHPFLL